MAILKFKVHADYEKVIRLKEEIAKLEKQLKSFGKNTPLIEIQAVEKRLSDAKTQFTAIISEAAKAGAVLENDFKNKIYGASQTVNGLTEKIIEQRSAIKGAEGEVRKLGEAYRKALKEDAGNAPLLKTDYDKAKDALMNEKNALFELTQEKAKASLETKKLRDEYAAFKKEAGDVAEVSEGLTMSFGKIAGLVGGAAALKELGSQVVKVRGEFQEMETVISTLVGQDMADKLMPQLKEMAKISPLSLGDIIGAEKMMLGFNIEADKTIGFLKALGDVSMGNSQKFNSLTLAFSQMSASGRLMGNDLNQMINAGFNPLQVIAEKTGKSIAQLKDEMSKGAISAEMVQQAFIDATSAGGRFYNMSENTSKLINGQMSMMQDAIDATLNAIGTKTEGIIIKGIQATTSLIQNYERIGKVLAGLVTTYGVYRTAVMLCTTATSKHTIAEIALTKVRIAARKAQQALNASMLTNPYVALATAVAGLVAGYIALKDNATAAEKAQERYNERKDTAAKKEKEHATAIQELIDRVRDVTQAESERVIALMALKNEYPKIFDQYDVEKLKLADILEIQKQINEENRQRSIASSKETIKSLSSDLVTMRYRGSDAKRVQAIQEEIELERRNLLSEDYANFVNSLAGLEDRKLDAVIQQLRDISEGTGGFKAEISGLIVNKENYSDFLEKYIEAAETERKKRSEVSSTYGQDYEAAKKEWEAAKKELDAIEKDKDAYATKQYEAAKTRYETAEKNFKSLGGDTTVKTTTEKDILKSYELQDKLDQAQDKADKDRIRTAKDNEFMVAQARIDAMHEGTEKQRAQRNLDNQKEIEQLERQKQDYIDKVVANERAIHEAQEKARSQTDKNYKAKAFNAEMVAAQVDTSAYDTAINLTLEKQRNQQDEVLRGLLEDYKSYEDEKQSIIISYLNDTDELQAMYEETGDKRYQRSLEERHKAYVKAMNALEKDMGKEYRLIFGDPEKMTSETIDNALEAARKKISELDKEADPETFKALSEAIERLENARDSNPFQGWNTSVMGLIQKLVQIRNIRKDIAKYEAEGNTDALESAKGQLERARKDMAKALIGTGVSEFGNALATAAASMREVANASGDIDLAKQAEALDKAGNVIASVASGAASGGWIGAIVGGATALMDMLVSSITESQVVAAKAKKAYEDYIDEIARSKRQVNDEDYETIFGVRALEKVVEASKDASKSMSDYYDILNKSKGTTYQYGNNDMIWQTGLGSQLVWEGKKQTAKNAYKVPTLQEKFPELFDANGNIVKDQAIAILDTYGEYAGEKWYEYLKDAVDALEDYEKNIGVVDEYLTSLFSDLGGQLADAIMKGNDALEVLEKNTGDIFASIARQLISELIVSDEFINKYKEKWRNVMATEDIADDAALVEETANALEANISNAMDAWERIKAIAEEKGISMSLGGEAAEQTASRKGYETVSEDTASELAGRALAQYESNLRMEESMRASKESIDMIAANQVQLRDIASETRTIIADSYLELQQIRENTGAVIKPIKDISADVKEMRRKLNNL